MKTLLSLFILLVLAASPALAEPPAAPGAEAGGMAHFLSGQGYQAMDADKDGRIGRQEFLDACSRRFETMDANKDGFVTKDEIQAVRAQAKERRERLREARDQRRQERQGQAAPSPSAPPVPNP